jgi:cyclohexa-1,5-dienecarbonyl-CoA hydratase
MDSMPGTAAPRTVLTSLRGRVGRITLARPPLNVLDVATLESLKQGIGRLEGAVDVLVLAGDGRCFCAGADVSDHGPERATAMLEAVEAVATELLDFPGVTLAAIRGECLGAGAEIALCCDFAVAADGATFGFPEIDLGCFPPIAAALLSQAVGRKATELILFGTRLTAAKAKELGILSEVVPPDALDEAVEAYLGKLLTKSGAALRAAVEALRGSPEEISAAVARFEHMRRIYANEVLPTDDAQEGVRAFLEKRAPVWKHR